MWVYLYQPLGLGLSIWRFAMIHFQVITFWFATTVVMKSTRLSAGKIWLWMQDIITILNGILQIWSIIVSVSSRKYSKHTSCGVCLSEERRSILTKRDSFSPSCITLEWSIRCIQILTLFGLGEGRLLLTNDCVYSVPTSWLFLKFT